MSHIFEKYPYMWQKWLGRATMDHKISFWLMVCSRTQGMTATLEDRGVCVCLKEEEKKSQRYNVWQSQPSTAPDTVEEHPDGHRPKWCEYWSTLYWKQEEQVGPYPFCFTWVLLDRKRNLYELCFLELGLYYLMDHDPLWLVSTELTWDVRCWNIGLLWDCATLVLMSAEVSTRVIIHPDVQIPNLTGDSKKKQRKHPRSWQVRKLTLSSFTNNVMCHGNSGAQPDMAAF